MLVNNKGIRLVIAMLLLWFTGSAQIYQQNTLFGVEFNRIRTKYAFGFAGDTLPVPLAYQIYPHLSAKDDIPYLWSPSQLKWIPWPGGGDSAGVLSFNGRTGAVSPLTGDYSAFYYPLSSNPAGYLTSAALTSYYTKTQINNFFSGVSLIGGYNKVYWDSAYLWGNHENLYPLIQTFYDSIYQLRQDIAAGGISPSDTADMLAPYLLSSVAAATYVPLSRTLTINGTTYDLSANRSWTISNTNSNIGSFYRWAVPNTNNIKTFAPGLWLTLDSTSNTNAITAKADSAGMAAYFLRRKDSNSTYTTPTWVLNAISTINPTLQQVIEANNVVGDNNYIDFNHDGTNFILAQSSTGELIRLSNSGVGGQLKLNRPDIDWNAVYSTTGITLYDDGDTPYLLQFPSDAATAGTIATQEWVNAQGLGAGSTPTFQEVTDAGFSTTNNIYGGEMAHWWELNRIGTEGGLVLLDTASGGALFSTYYPNRIEYFNSGMDVLMLPFTGNALDTIATLHDFRTLAGSLSGSNIYNTDGTLTGNRTVSLNDNNLIVNDINGLSVFELNESSHASELMRDDNAGNRSVLSVQYGAVVLTSENASADNSHFYLYPTYSVWQTPTPRISSLAGNGSGIVAVNNDGDLSFSSGGGGGPSLGYGAAHQMFTTNATEDGYEWVTPINLDDVLYDNDTRQLTFQMAGASDITRTLPLATLTHAGMMSAEDKSLLDSIRYHNQYFDFDSTFHPLGGFSNDSTIKIPSFLLEAGTNVTLDSTINSNVIRYKINASGGSAPTLQQVLNNGYILTDYAKIYNPGNDIEILAGDSNYVSPTSVLNLKGNGDAQITSTNSATNYAAILLNDNPRLITLQSTNGGSTNQVIVTPTTFLWGADTVATRAYARSVGGGGGSLSDGDYGDIVVSGSGTTMAIDAGVIVNADINSSAAIEQSKIANLPDSLLKKADKSQLFAIDTTNYTHLDDLYYDSTGKASNGFGTIKFREHTGGAFSYDSIQVLDHTDSIETASGNVAIIDNRLFHWRDSSGVRLVRRTAFDSSFSFGGGGGGGGGSLEDLSYTGTGTFSESPATQWNLTTTCQLLAGKKIAAGTSGKYYVSLKDFGGVDGRETVLGLDLNNTNEAYTGYNYAVYGTSTYHIQVSGADTDKGVTVTANGVNIDLFGFEVVDNGDGTMAVYAIKQRYDDPDFVRIHTFGTTITSADLYLKANNAVGSRNILLPKGLNVANP